MWTRDLSITYDTDVPSISDIYLHSMWDVYCAYIVHERAHFASTVTSLSAYRIEHIANIVHILQNRSLRYMKHSKLHSDVSAFYEQVKIINAITVKSLLSTDQPCTMSANKKQTFRIMRRDVARVALKMAERREQNNSVTQHGAQSL